MSKIVTLRNGKKVDFDVLCPPKQKLPKNHLDEYDPADDIYEEVTEKDKNKYMKLNNGKIINLDLLYPKKESVYHIKEYDKEDDVYNDLLSKEDKIKYGIK